MVDMGIFKVLLECAYGLDILHYEDSNDELTFGYLKLEYIKSCYILTNDGDIDIDITVKYNEDKTYGTHVVSYSSKFSSNLNSFSDDLVKELIFTQLETEAFLHHGDYKSVKCSCECF